MITDKTTMCLQVSNESQLTPGYGRGPDNINNCSAHGGGSLSYTYTTPQKKNQNQRDEIRNHLPHKIILKYFQYFVQFLNTN